MTRFAIAAMALGALTLTGCAQAQGGSPAQTAQAAPAAPAAPPAQQAQAPGAPQRPAGALPATPNTGCVAPVRRTLTLRRGEQLADNSLVVLYSGRDPTFRTAPYVYAFQTNAELLNRDGTIRDSNFFALWRGETAQGRICGRNIQMQLLNVSDTQVTLQVSLR